MSDEDDDRRRMRTADEAPDDTSSSPYPEKAHNHEGRSAIVVIAKCPIPGTSKTRLAKGDASIGATGAATLARAMLSDVLMTLSKCVSPLVKPKSHHPLSPISIPYHQSPLHHMSI